MIAPWTAGRGGRLSGWLTASLLVACLLPATAASQDVSDLIRPRALEIGAGALIQGSSPLGPARATETLNQIGSADQFTLFETDTRLKTAAGFHGTVAINLSRVLAAEGSFLIARVPMETSISRDVEGAPSTTFIGERLSQYAMGAGLIVHLPWLAFGRGVPYVATGARYLRQLHETGELAATGRIYHLGGGLKYFFFSRRAALVKAIGVRGEGGVSVRTGGVDLAARRRTFRTGHAGLTVAF